MVDIVDENDNVVRKAARKEAREQALMYRSSTVIVRNNGEYFVQKRSEKKDLWPGMLAIGVGETVQTGESYEEAAIRGLKEEIGISAKPRYLFHMMLKSSEDNEHINVYECFTEEQLKFNDGEVAEGFFASKGKLKKMLETAEFTPASKAALHKYWEFKKRNLIDEVDEDDKVTGSGSYDEIVKEGKIFRSANVIILNSSGKLFAHKRSRNLDTFPGRWDIKMGGIVDSGETYEEAAKRELKEEAGIENAELEFLFPLKYRSDKYKNNRKIYRTAYDGKMKLQEEEIEEGKLVTIEEAKRMMEKGMLSPSAAAVLQEYLKWEKS